MATLRDCSLLFSPFLLTFRSCSNLQLPCILCKRRSVKKEWEKKEKRAFQGSFDLSPFSLSYAMPKSRGHGPVAATSKPQQRSAATSTAAATGAVKRTHPLLFYLLFSSLFSSISSIHLFSSVSSISSIHLFSSTSSIFSSIFYLLFYLLSTSSTSPLFSSISSFLSLLFYPSSTSLRLEKRPSPALPPPPAFFLLTTWAYTEFTAGPCFVWVSLLCRRPGL